MTPETSAKIAADVRNPQNGALVATTSSAPEPSVPPLGSEIRGKVIALVAVVANSDQNEGRGTSYDAAYFERRGDAEIRKLRVAIARLEDRLALRLVDGRTYLLAPIRVEPDSDVLAARAALRAETLAALSEAQKVALGLAE